MQLGKICCGVFLLSPAAAKAQAWTEAAGDVRAALALSRIASTQQFAPGDALGLTGPLCPEPVFAGQRSPYSCVTGGTFVATQLALDVAAGLTDWLSVDLNVPTVIDARFQDDIGTTRASGLGDIRLGARVGTRAGPLALSAFTRVKAPTGPRNFQDREVPIGDGQWDVRLGGAVGRSLWPWGWVQIEQSLRIRGKNGQTGVDPGEEWLGLVGFGIHPLGPEIGLQAGADWLISTRDQTDFGIGFPGRKYLQARLSVFSMPIEPLWLEAGVVLPIWGQRWPTAPGLVASVAYRFQTRQPATDNSVLR